VPRTLVIPLVAVLALAPGAPAAPSPAAATELVVCAPGYPGDTASAQPTMDLFARIASDAAAWPAGSLRAVYFETAEGGLQRLARDDAALALVSLPFFLQHEKELMLQARLQVAEDSGALAAWSLAARRGRVPSSAALDGFEITGVAGYAPEFVRGPVLGGFGPLPPTARVTSTANVLSALRRAASGASIAVVLDDAQAKALATLPFAADLEIVARSLPMPRTLLCTVGGRLPPRQSEAIARGLEKLHTRPEWAEILKAMRMTRFEAVDVPALDLARRLFAAVRTPADPAGFAPGKTGR
jgi:hypothetical protein